MTNDQFKKNWQKQKIAKSKSFQLKASEEVNELVIKSRQGKLITLDDGSQLKEFISCSYLGLDADLRVIEAATKSILECGVTFPCARTRARTESFVTLDLLLNKIFCNGYSTTFSTLHLGHLGTIPLLASGELPSFPIKENGPVFILDKSVHASIQILRGIMQQFGEVVLIEFTDIDLMEKKFLECYQNQQTPILFSDSIGSMGGVAQIDWLTEKVEQYEGYLYLDDAHGTSTYGKNGAGYVLQCLDYQFHARLILAASLAKAFGAVGGVIVMPTEADEKMIKRFASTYIFGGPPPLSIIDSAIASAGIHLSGEIESLQNKLWGNVNYFDSLIHEHIVNSEMLSPIRGIFIGDEFKAIQSAKRLRELGYAVTTAMYPTVASGNSILRVALSAVHSHEDIHGLCENVKLVLKEIGIKKAGKNYHKIRTPAFKINKPRIAPPAQYNRL